MNIKQAYEFKRMREAIDDLLHRVEELENKKPAPARRGRPPKNRELNYGDERRID
jgi:hypothetical protein